MKSAACAHDRASERPTQAAAEGSALASTPHPSHIQIRDDHHVSCLLASAQVSIFVSCLAGISQIYAFTRYCDGSLSGGCS